MTVVLMLENLIKMILQTVYNMISFILQLISLLPICIVILVTARIKCFMCSGYGSCPTRNGVGICDCLISLAAIALLFFIFRTTGVLDKIFYKLGYAKVSTGSKNDTKFYDIDDDGSSDDKETTIYARKFHMRVLGEYLKDMANTVSIIEQTTEEQNSEVVNADSSTTPLLTDSSNLVKDISKESLDHDDNENILLTLVGPSPSSTIIDKLIKKQGNDNLTDEIYSDISIEPDTTESRARIKLKPSKPLKKKYSQSEMTITVVYYLVS